MSDIPHGYYAVPDPDQPDTITRWRSHARTRHGVTTDVLDPWPDKAKYGPILYKRDVPRRQPERDQVREAFWARRRAWETRIRDTIAADLDAARARFAGDTVRCYDCGRVLTDDTSKALGIGPECRREGPHYPEEEIRGAVRNAVETTRPGDPFRTWEWDRPIQGRARKREHVTVRLHPDNSPGSRACVAVLERLNSRRPKCTGPLVWEVFTRGAARSLGHSFACCDLDLPEEYRPLVDAELHSLF